MLAKRRPLPLKSCLLENVSQLPDWEQRLCSDDFAGGSAAVGIARIRGDLKILVATRLVVVPAGWLLFVISNFVQRQ